VAVSPARGLNIFSTHQIGQRAPLQDRVKKFDFNPANAVAAAKEQLQLPC
jgi:hypothetical protein